MPPPWQRYQSWSIPELDPFIWDGEEEQIEEYALDEEPFQWDGESIEEPSWYEAGKIAITEALPGAWKQQAGGGLQAMGTPSDATSYGHLATTGYRILSDIVAKSTGDVLQEKGKELYKAGEQQAKEARAKFVPGSGKALFSEIIEATAAMGGPIMAGILTRNPNLSLQLIGTQVGASTYGEGVNNLGLDPQQATIRAAYYALSEALSEKIPLSILTRRGGGYFINIAKSAGAEAIQEPVNQVLQELYDAGVLGKDMTLDETIANLEHAAKVGGGTGALLSAITGLFLRRKASGNAPDIDKEIPNVIDPEAPSPIERDPETDETIIDVPLPTEPEPTIFDPEIAQPGESIFQEEQIEEEQIPSQAIDPGRTEEVPSVSALATNQDLARKKWAYLERMRKEREKESFTDFKSRNDARTLSIDDDGNAYISIGDTKIPVTERNYAIDMDGKPIVDKQNNLQYNDSNRTDILALERRRSPEVEANYQALVDLLSKWHKVFGEDVGVRPINIVFESMLIPQPEFGDTRVEPFGYKGQIDFVNNELKIPIQQLLLADNKNFRETVVHELLHAKFFSLFEAKVRRERLSRGLDLSDQDQITNKAAELYTDFAHQLVKPLEKEIKIFLNSHPEGEIGRVLNLPTDSKFYNSSPDEIFKGLLEHDTYFEGKGANIVFPVIHELLAYQAQGDDFLTMPSESLTPEQRTFREKIIRVIQQVLSRLFAGQPEAQELTREDVIDFTRSMFYENAGLFEAGTAERTPFYQAGATEREKTDIRLQAEMEGVAPPPVSQARDPSIDEEARLPELEQQLTTAKDRLKLLNRRIAPPGFEGEYSPEDFAQDISTTKDTIETLKEEIKETRKGLRQRDMGKAEDVDLGRRRFMQQGATIAAGAAVDPTILAEGAAKVAPTAAEAVRKPAITTVYKFAESILVDDQIKEEGYEGEIVYDIVYDSSQPNQLEVNKTIGQDDVETYIIDDIMGEEALEPGKRVSLDMQDVDKIVSDMILEGVDPTGAETEWNTKNIHSVQAPERDPFGEEGNNANPMTAEEKEGYSDADLEYLENIGGEVSTIGPVDPVGAKGPRLDLEAAPEVTRDKATGKIRAVSERKMKPAKTKPGVDVAATLLDTAIKEKAKEITEEPKTREEQRKEKLAAEKEQKALPPPPELKQTKRLPRKKERAAELRKEEDLPLFEDLTKGINEKTKVKLEKGGHTTIGAIARNLSGEGRPEGKYLKPYDFYVAFLSLMYSPKASNLVTVDNVGRIFNVYNRKAKILATNNLGSNVKGEPIQIPAGALFTEWTTTRGRIIGLASDPNTKVLEFKNNNRPIVPIFSSIKEDTLKVKPDLTFPGIFDAWLNDQKLNSIQEGHKDSIIDGVREYFKGKTFDNEITTHRRFTKQWFQDNNNEKFPYKNLREKEFTNSSLFTIGKREHERITSHYLGTKRQKRLKQSVLNASNSFIDFLEGNFDDVLPGWAKFVGKVIYNRYQKLKKEKGVLTDEEKTKFLEDNLGINISHGRSGTLPASFRKHEKVRDKIIDITKVPWAVDHILDIGREITKAGKKISIGIEHAIGYLILPDKINAAIKHKKYRDNPFINPWFATYFNAFYDFINKNKKDYKNKATTLYIDAAVNAFDILKQEYPDVDWGTSELSKEQIKGIETIEETDVGTISQIEARKDIYKSLPEQIELQKSYVKSENTLFGTIYDDYKGEVVQQPKLNQAVSTKVEPDIKVEEYSRAMGSHQRFWTNFATFMWSKPVEALRRYRYASTTMARLADMIQRDPSETKRVVGLKGGLDYIQRKGMAMGQFRVSLQAALDVLTGRFGVIDRDTNDEVALFLATGRPISDPKIAKAAERIKQVIEGIYVWSQEHGTKGTKGFSLRPLDGGLLPRVWNIEELNTEAGRKKFMKLLEGIGIVDNPDAKNDYEKYAATDAYNIAINSGGFISGDFTTTAYNQKSKKTRKYQVELFEKIEKEISRKDLGILLVNDLQAALPRFVDKAVEKTLYAELFGHYDEKIWEMKAQIEKEISDYNRKDSTKRRVNPEAAMKEVNDMMDIIRHRYKMDTAWFGARRFTQWFMNFSTVTLMPLVTLASMPEFFTPLALGSKNPVGFMNDLRMAGVYAGLRAMNGMSKVFRGKQLDAMLYPKGKTAKRAMFLKALGIIDIKSQGESAAVRYVGPSFIRTGVAAQGMGSKLIMKNLYKLFGLGSIPKGRFRARKGRAIFNMDTVFEMYLLTTVTQMQQVMAANNLQRYVLSTLKSLSKAQKGKKGLKLDSTIKQQIKILKDFGLTPPEIKEAIRWYDAGHREFYDVPGEFNWDPRGITLRFVDQVITRPNEATAAKAFKHPGMAPLLLFKSFMTTYANTYMVAIRDRVRFAEGDGSAKAYQQAKMAAGLLATFAAMYGMVLFTQAVRQMIQFGDDDDDYMQDVPEWKKFIGMVNRTGLLTAPGSQLADVWIPYKYGWWQRPSERLESTLFGPGVNQAKTILDLVGDLANKGEVDIEKFLGQVVPVTKYEAFRDIVGAPSYYEN